MSIFGCGYFAQNMPELMITLQKDHNCAEEHAPGTPYEAKHHGNQSFISVHQHYTINLSVNWTFWREATK